MEHGSISRETPSITQITQIFFSSVLQGDGACPLRKFERNGVADTYADVAVGTLLHRVRSHFLDRVHLLRYDARSSEMAEQLGHMHGPRLPGHWLRLGKFCEVRDSASCAGVM